MNRDGYASDLLVTPQRKAELTSRFARYMAESLQDSQLLYYILHYTLEMSHAEIEALGFALSEHYETEEPEAKPMCACCRYDEPGFRIERGKKV